MTSDALRVELSRKIRSVAPEDWKSFSQLWMAFNALYGGEPDRRERARVMRCIRRAFTEKKALKVLRAIRHAADRILEIPPGDMRLDQRDPSFRAATQRCRGAYKNPRETAVGRLSALGGVLYQVRCNLMHGSKNPENARDRMLVTESRRIMAIMIPELEDCLSKA